MRHGVRLNHRSPLNMIPSPHQVFYVRVAFQILDELVQCCLSSFLVNRKGNQTQVYHFQVRRVNLLSYNVVTNLKVGLPTCFLHNLSQSEYRFGEMYNVMVNSKLDQLVKKDLLCYFRFSPLVFNNNTRENN